MNGLTLKRTLLFSFCFLSGAFLGAFAVFFTNPLAHLKIVGPLHSLEGAGAEFFNHALGVRFGPFVVHYTDGSDDATIVMNFEGTYPVVTLQKTGNDTITVSISDRDQNILSGDLENGEFRITSYLKIIEPDIRKTSIDLNADGIYDLLARQSEDSTEIKVLFDGSWYPYKAFGGKKMIQMSDGWEEVVIGPMGFELKKSK